MRLPWKFWNLFLTRWSLNVYISWIEQDKILLSQLWHCADQNGPQRGEGRGEHWKTDKARKADEKNEVICQLSFFLSRVTVLKLPNIVHFLKICADLSKKSKSIKAIYLYPSERTHHALSENDMVYSGLSNSSRNIEE